LFILILFKIKSILPQNTVLRKHFVNEPLSQSVALNSQTSFTCLPPEGDPKPTLFWLKNGEIINASNRGTAQISDNTASDIIPDNLSAEHDNYFIAHDSSLIIKEATLKDQANYTCAVRNPAGVRYSEAAQLTVFGKTPPVFLLFITSSDNPLFFFTFAHIKPNESSISLKYFLFKP
jgi:hypothetical protein